MNFVKCFSRFIICFSMPGNRYLKDFHGHSEVNSYTSNQVYKDNNDFY